MAHELNQRKNLMRSTSAQINLLVDYMVANKDFTNGSGEYAGVAGAKKADEEWETLRQQLKQHGTDKSVLQWKQTWRDLKRKARKMLEDNKDQVPVTDGTVKILKAIDLINQDCSMEIETSDSMPNESCEGEFESGDNSLLAKNENDDTNNEYTDKESTKSEMAVESEDDNMRSLIEVVVPMPQIQRVYSQVKKPQRDPLQAVAKMPRLPLLAPKPSKAMMRELATYVTRPRQLLTTRATQTQQSSDSTQVPNNFVMLELQRLKMDDERDKRLHEREMERLKLELQRVEAQRNHNELLQQLVNIAQNACDLLQQRLQ